MANPKITEPTKRAPGETRRIPRLRLKSHRIGSGALTGLGGLLLACELPILGVPAALAGGGYLLATYLLSGVLKAGDEDIDNWVKVLDERGKVLTARAAELKQDKAAAKALLAKIETKMRETEQQARRIDLDLKAKYEQRLAQTAGVMESDYQQRLTEAIATCEDKASEAIASADARALLRVKKHTSRLVGHNKQLHKRVGELEEQIEQRDAYLLGEFNQRIESYRSGYSEIQQAIDIQGRSVGEARAAFEAQYEALLNERDRLHDEVRRLSAPRRFQFKGIEYDTANSIQEFLQERGIILACHEVGRNHYGSVPLSFEARSPHGASDIKPYLEALQLRLGLPELPTAAIKDSGLIEIVVQLSRETVPEKAIAIVDPPLTKLERALQESIHVRIAANSGSGKSVLLGNLVNYLCSVFVPDYHLSDPKVTSPKVWGNLKPRYYSFECLDHLFGLISDVMRRVEKAKEAVKNDKPIPAFNPQFHIFDEMEMLYGLSEVVDVKEFTPKAFKNNVKMMLKAGREHQLKLLFVTQSPLPSDLNLRKNDFFNTSSILLGKCISDALYDESSEALLSDLSREKKAQLKAEYRARLMRKDKYFFLFYNPNKPLEAWFGKCPPPGYYANQAPPSTAKPATPTFGGLTLQHFKPVENAVTDTVREVQTSTATSLAVADPEQITEASTDPGPALEAKLEEGTYCPKCKHHTTSYRKIRPNGKGNISATCKNPKCETKTFTWNVLQLPEVENR